RRLRGRQQRVVSSGFCGHSAVRQRARAIRNQNEHSHVPSRIAAWQPFWRRSRRKAVMTPFRVPGFEFRVVHSLALANAERRRLTRNPKPETRNLTKSFTIIEVMIALFMFSLVLMAIYATWLAILKGSKAGRTAAAAVQRSRIAI